MFYNRIDIKNFVSNIISNSTLHDSHKDLEQYIWLYLLELPNEKLLSLYNKNLLHSYITTIIFNQRNYYRSEYNLNYKNYNEDITDKEYKYEEDDNISEEMFEILESILNKYKLEDYSTMNQMEQYKLSSMEVLKMYYLDRRIKHSYNSLAKALNLNRVTIMEMVRYGKEYIKNEIEKHDNITDN